MNWAETKLGLVAEINPRSRDWTTLPPETQVSFIPMAAISERTATITENVARPLAEVRKGYTPFRNDDVLFAKITPCMENGKAALATSLQNGIGFGSTEFHVLRARPGTLPKFIYFFVRQSDFRLAARQRFRGAAGQQRVPEDFLEDYPFPAVAISEQCRVVELLEQADELRRQRVEADSIAARILPALFYNHFGNPATNSLNWPKTKIGSVVTETSYGTSCQSNTNGDGLPVLRMNNITSAGQLNLSDLKHVLLGEGELAKQRLQAGDLLFNRTNTKELVGKTGLWRGQMQAVAASYLIRVRADRSQVLPDYLWAWMNTPFFKQLLFDISRRAVGMANINATELRSMPILVPTLHRQELFAEHLCSLETLADKRKESARSLETLFAVMLHRAFTGNLTAQWREAHMKELLAEMEQQSRLLRSNPKGRN